MIISEQLIKSFVEDYTFVGGTNTVTYHHHSSDETNIFGTPINDANTLTLEQLLSTEYGFDAFIHHIAQEFCVETLLSCVEFTQFQLFYGEKTHISFTKYVPQSSIVNNNNYSCHDKIRKLCQKYILNGSELELNISYRMRIFNDFI